jgi:phage terminase large subunit GpA-like protein
MIRHLLMVAIALLPYADLLAAGAEAWTPAPRPIRWQWCEQNLRIPSETAATPGRFDVQQDHAFLLDIFEAIDDPDIRKVTIIGCSQIGKTEFIRAIALSQAEVARAPMMLAGPDEIYSTEQRDEIYARALASPALRDRVPERAAWNKRIIDLEKCRIFLAWSGSSQRMSGRACRIVLASEADRWQKSPAFVEERVKAFPGGTTIIVEGTPVGASPYLEASYQQSDRRTFEVPCPVCGHHQELRMFPHRHGPYAGNGGVAGMKNDADKWLSPEEARLNAYYLCERGCRIEPDQKHDMVRRGVWAAEGQTVNKAGKRVGNPTYPGRHAGFRLNSLMSSTIGFGDMAEKWLTVRDDTELLCRFWNDWLGRAFIPRGKTPRWKDLGIRLAGSHARGTIPAWCYFLTAASDVQERGCYWIVRGWGDGKTSALVDFGYLPKDLLGGEEDSDATEARLASDLAKIDPVLLQRRFPVDGVNPGGFEQLAVRMLGIDRGYRQTDVATFLAAHPGPRVLAVFGDPQITPGSLYRPMKTQRDVHTGRIDEDDPRTWGLETNAFKSEIADRWMMADPTQPGGWWLPSDILQTDHGEDYLRQITAETKSLELVNGRKVLRWNLISHNLPNHYFDCEVYANAIAEMITGGDWDASHWRMPVRRPPVDADVSVREPQEGFAAR